MKKYLKLAKDIETEEVKLLSLKKLVLVYLEEDVLEI
jgi:hypothetical protein